MNLEYSVKSILINGFLIVILTFALSSCELKEVDDLNDLGWNPNIVGPVAQKRVSLDDLKELEKFDKTFSLEAQRIPGFIAGIPVEIPAFGPLPADEFHYLNFSEYTTYIHFDDVSIDISIENSFPISIGAGTEIVCRDSVDHNNVLFSYVLSSDFQSGQTLNIPISVSNQGFGNTIEFFIDNFQSPGTNGQLVQLTNEHLRVTVDIESVDIGEVHINSDFSYEIVSKNDFSLEIDNPQDTIAYSGSFSLFVENMFPASAEIIVSLMDENGNIVKTIAGESGSFVVQSGNIGRNGHVTSSSSSSLIDFISVQDINNVHKVSCIYVDAKISAGSSSHNALVIDKNSFIDVQLTANVQVNSSLIN